MIEGVSMRNRVTAYTLAMLIVFSAACGGQKVTPQPLTPEQRLALAKITITTGITGIDLRLSQIPDTPATAVRLRILRAARGILDEFNNQIKDLTTINLSNAPAVREAIKRGLDAVDRLTTVDVLELKDAKAQAEIKAGIALVRVAFEGFATFLPAQ